MKVNDVVFQDYQGIRRYGVTTEKTMKNGWSWWRVKWFNDEPYERAMAVLFELRGVDHYRKEYRVDELRCIEAQSEIEKLCLCLNYLQQEEKSFGQTK